MAVGAAESVEAAEVAEAEAVGVVAEVGVGAGLDTIRVTAGSGRG